MTGTYCAPYGAVGPPMGPACEPVGKARLNGGGVPVGKPVLSND